MAIPMMWSNDFYLVDIQLETSTITTVDGKVKKYYQLYRFLRFLEEQTSTKFSQAHETLLTHLKSFTPVAPNQHHQEMLRGLSQE